MIINIPGEGVFVRIDEHVMKERDEHVISKSYG